MDEFSNYHTRISRFNLRCYNMKYLLPAITVILLVLSCEPMDEQISPEKGLKLTFSEDTVLFDTLLTVRTSITKRFRIFNPNEKAVEISSIRLGKGAASDYNIIVNGRSGSELKDEVLFGGDSILVLVEVDIDPQDENLPYLVKDSVIVEWNQNADHVKLVAWGQDANFINGGVICDVIWTADRPYVIRSYALVDSLCTLTVEPGTRIYLDNQAALYVQGTLKVLGDSANRVIIRNTRFDEAYQEAPGQWDAIYFLEGSKNNEVHYADIENGAVGLRVGSPDEDDEFDLVVSHTSIRHMSVAGILAFTSDIYAYNIEVYNVSTFLVGNFAGGNYRYEHCTFVNQPSFFINEDPMVQIADFYPISDNEAIAADLTISIVNSIIWGTGKEELFVSDGGGQHVSAQIENNIIRLPENYDSDYFSSGDNFLSQEADFPGFADAYMFNYRPDSVSFARDRGLDIGIDTDLEGKIRDNKPDIGAFERTDE